MDDGDDLAKMREMAGKFYEKTAEKPKNFDALDGEEKQALRLVREQNRELLRGQGLPEGEIDNLMGPEPDWS